MMIALFLTVLANILQIETAITFFLSVTDENNW